jgi:thioredoxin 1
MIEVIKFGAEWCGPCKLMSPYVNQLMQKYNTEGSEISVLDVDVDSNPELASEHKIKTIPTLIFKINDEVVDRKSGVMRKEEIEKIIESLKEQINDSKK